MLLSGSGDRRFQCKCLLQPRRYLHFYSADLRYQGTYVAHWQPICEALPPHQRVFVNDAIDPGFAENRECAWTAGGVESVSVCLRERERVWEGNETGMKRSWDRGEGMRRNVVSWGVNVKVAYL